MTDFDKAWRGKLSALRMAGRERRLRPMERDGNGRLLCDGRVLVDFSSNDYLGLAGHPEISRRAAAFAERFGGGATASRLVCGESPALGVIEEKLARGKEAEAALVLASGFQANLSLFPALLDAGALEAGPILFADRLNHASMIDGAILAGARQMRFRHNDLGHLEGLLQKHQPSGRALFIATETVFSMDGDRADIEGLRALADRYGAFLYLDEAHATGVFGERGFGLAPGMAGPDCLVMGTFSKALGGFGAYAATSASLRSYLINCCRGLIYSTALPPAVLGAMDAALDLAPQMGEERRALQENAERFRARLRGAGLDVGASSTQIVPVIVGAEEKTLHMAARLEEEGFLGVAIRPPTVPPGKARIRFALSVRHSREQIDDLAACVIRLAEECL